MPFKLLTPLLPSEKNKRSIKYDKATQQNTRVYKPFGMSSAASSDRVKATVAAVGRMDCGGDLLDDLERVVHLA